MGVALWRGAGLMMGDSLSRVSAGSEPRFSVAITDRDPLLLGVPRRRLLDDGAQELAIGLDPVAYPPELRAVPLHEAHGAAAFVVGARELDGLKQAHRAELLQAAFVDVDVLETPADLLTGQRLIAELGLGDAYGFDVEYAIVDPEVVIPGADPLRIGHVPLAGLKHVLVDLSQDWEIAA